MAIVAADVVHPGAIFGVGFGHGPVPLLGPSCDIACVVLVEERINAELFCLLVVCDKS